MSKNPSRSPCQGSNRRNFPLVRGGFRLRHPPTGGGGGGFLRNNTKIISFFLVAAAAVILLLPGLVVFHALAADNSTVHLRVEGSNETYFDNRVPVEDCTITDTQGVSHPLAKVAACALSTAAVGEQLPVEFSDFGFGLFLQSIGQDITPADYSFSWSFWVNDEPANVGLDQYQVKDGDEILLAFSVYPAIPLRVVTVNQATVGQSFSIPVEKLVGDYDTNFTWHGSWQPFDQGKLHLGDDLVDLPASGVFTVTINQPQELTAWADGAGFIRSAKQIIQIQPVSVTPTPQPISSPTPSPAPSTFALPSATVTPSPTPWSTINPDILRERAARALTFLRNQQQPDGSVGGEMVSAWSAIAFGSAGESACQMKSGEGRSLCSALLSSELTQATDLERVILAVRAAGENPRVFGNHNLVADLKSHFHDNQFGETSLINDDIFGVLALLAADDTVTSQEITGSISHILDEQKSDGSWGSVDLTAAAIQALRAYQQRGGDLAIDHALTKARFFLLANQDKYGGFGANSASTAWAIQAILSLGENPDDWTLSNGLNPWHALFRYQHDNGGFGWQSNATADVSTFMTTYAITALNKKPWPITILDINNSSVMADAATIAPSLTTSPTKVSAAQPTVAGLMDNAATSPENPPLTISSSTAPTENLNIDLQPSSSITPPPTTDHLINPPATDYFFTLTGFSLANAGIGFFISRIFVKLW